MSLLDNLDGVIIEINGHRVSTEEAALTWNEMSPAERSKYQGLTDIQVIETIYSTLFKYKFDKVGQL